MITKITSFTAHQTAEGMRVTYTYSQINDDGDLVKSNQRATTIAMSDDIIGKIEAVNDWLLTKAPK